MRPPDLPGGNIGDCGTFGDSRMTLSCFNEAAGFTRRKPVQLTASKACNVLLGSFNEAAGFTRRKRSSRSRLTQPPDARPGFNEAAGFTRRKRELEGAMRS